MSTIRIRIRFLLVGILLGQLLMLPVVKWFEKTPQIEAVVIPTKVFQSLSTRGFIVQDVPSVLRSNEASPLKIIITTQKNIQQEHIKRFGEERSGDGAVLGFYDKDTHEIWSIDSTDILVHELRHVFEGYFHR